MKKIYALALLITVIFISGCNDHFYAPALYNNNSTYLAKPMHTDSAKSASYVSGGLGLGSGIDLKDNTYMGLLRLDHANTFDNINLAYGVFGFAGSYENTSIEKTEANYFNNKFFAGLGANASANFFIPLNDKVDLRIIGIDLAYSSEFGDYADFRKAVRSQPGFHTDINNNLFSGGLTTEVAWRGRNNPQIHYAVKGYLGKTFGNHDFNDYTNSYYNNSEYNNINYSASFFVQMRKYFFVVERQNIVNVNLRVGYCF
ncbi:hypothetical protein BDD43_4031 [Mucilaginibacter gracilis]|uniref:Uncharacterized protein n=1 Tax=Mucilaginibacter gracilis TaxID=423350 RepID=A0A495J4D2_9SPHI|nr:hypothetical protein [Mucilaginibacter gracilis]RKR83817.1 hypothetical protein BDD43_4031 [Mucilaginibacter gracilis]